jgi:hypothetical protein
MYFDFRDEHKLAPLSATPAHMARYVAWLEHLGTIKTSSLQAHMLAINGFFKDHGLEAFALGGLGKKRTRRVASSDLRHANTSIHASIHGRPSP